MPDQLLEASATAVLGFIAVALVLFLIKRSRNGNGNHDAESEDRLRIVRSVAYIEEHGIEMPGNWREFVDARILHKRRSDAMQFGILATLLRKGHVGEAADLLEALERDAKEAVNRRGDPS